ncbi:MAG: radical SAM protein [Thermoplasmata archaeon]|nr:radical SAM protein [Thermoplasmata archaeon]
MESDIAFGPVPSRRLGRSMGINNIPPKICTYSCVYCQLGRTLDMQVERKEFYSPEKVMGEVERKVREAEDSGERVDYLTFVPDGEPTLDINLGREIDMLKQTGIKIAVITNSSLIWREDVRNELCGADWVSLKVDSVTEDTWHRVDRPHGRLELGKIMDGIEDFSRDFEGELATETMLVSGFNDGEDETGRIASFISGLKTDKSYISIPTRPPAEKWVKPAPEYNINAAYQIFSNAGIDAEYLIGYEGNEFSSTGNAEEDLLGIMSVHPMREDAVKEFLEKGGAGMQVIEKMLAGEKIIELDYGGNRFYMRKLSGKHR